MEQMAHAPGGRGDRVVSAARIGALVAVLWAVSQQVRHAAPSHRWVALGCSVLAGCGWLGWLASRHYGARREVTVAALVLMAAAGGVLSAYAPIAICFLAVASLGAAVALELRVAVAVAVVGLLALGIAVAVVHSTDRVELVLEGALATVAGLVAGVSRRQYQARTAHAEALLEERVRADAERDRAAALAERNRLARELHDVLAHSLGALTVQLEAADALLERGDDETARAAVHRARGLAADGLVEARKAVKALRNEPVGLVEQVTSLAEREGVALRVVGEPRPLGDATQLALYRAAQEALTNARKHAPGAPVGITLEFDPTETVLVVGNGHAGPGAGHASLRRSGAGFGLHGMRERIEEAGGRLASGPSGDGWEVRAAVPA